MGTVEAALELHTDGTEPTEEAAYERVVALKRLLPDAARDRRRLDMFLREAKLAKLLDHPNVVRAFDYGELDGELFLAMEYVEGQSLSRVLKALAEEKGELGTSLAAHVLAEVCEGLHAAHELRDEDGQSLNLVHRDVSPQNVMLGYDGHVRLLDFGVAKIEAESVTKTGEVKGKTAYMSPEQAMGDAIDRRSDLFGVGAVLFECLALRRMWGDGTDMDVIRKLALEKPPRLEDAVPSAPAPLCALYTRLVAREAKERPATAHDVAEELRKLVPEGREEANRALRKLLDSHFSEQAEEQRRKLTRSLEEVAPEQARELRESVSPEPATPPSVRSVGVPRARPSTASIADATGANPVSTGDSASAGVAGVEAANRESRPWPWLLAAALLLAGVGVWRATTPVTAPTATAVGSVPSIAPTIPSASASASAPASALAPAFASTSPSAPASARSPLPATSARPPAPVSPSVPVARPSATSATSATRPPGVSTTATATAPKPPPDVDDHPF
jgi:serine/threonine protein kinase